MIGRGVRFSGTVVLLIGRQCAVLTARWRLLMVWTVVGLLALLRPKKVRPARSIGAVWLVAVATATVSCFILLGLVVLPLLMLQAMCVLSCFGKFRLLLGSISVSAIVMLSWLIMV